MPLPPAGIDEQAQMIFNYHLYIALKSGNNVIPMVLNGFHDVSAVFWKEWIRFGGIDAAVIFLEQFTALIAAGNGDGAMQLYRDNANRFLERYV